MKITWPLSIRSVLIARLSTCILLAGVATGVAGCVVEPAPPEAAYGGPCCYAYYDYPAYARPYYGYPREYWGGDRRWR